MARRKRETLDLATTGNKGPVDVRQARAVSLHLIGISGGGSVTVEASADNGTSWQAIGAARTADAVVTITDLYDYVRLNVGTGKASAHGEVHAMMESENA